MNRIRAQSQIGGTPHVVPIGFSYYREHDTIDVGGRQLEQTKGSATLLAMDVPCERELGTTETLGSQDKAAAAEHSDSRSRAGTFS
jgi:hypothetical protein